MKTGDFSPQRTRNKQKNTLMAEYGKKEHLSFCHSRLRWQAENDRRLCSHWISEMVNKLVKKQTSELRAEFHLMNLELRQQMESELRKHLREPEVKEAGAAPQRCTAQDPECTATRQLVEVEDNHGDREQDEGQLFSHTVSSGFSEVSNSSDDGFDYVKISEQEISPLSADGHSLSYQTECGPINSQTVPSEAPSVSDDDPPTKQSEKKESTKHPPHLFMLSEQERKQEIAHADEPKLTEARLMAFEWNKWLDEQERRVSHISRKPQHKKNAEKPERIDKHAVATRQKTAGLTDTMKRFGTSVSHLFYPLTSTSYKWEKLEEKD